MELDKKDLEAFELIYKNQQSGIVGSLILSVIFLLIPVFVKVFVPENFSWEMVICFILLILCLLLFAGWEFSQKKKFQELEQEGSKKVVIGRVEAFYKNSVTSRVISVNGIQYEWSVKQSSKDLESLEVGDSVRIHLVGRDYVLRLEKTY